MAPTVDSAALLRHYQRSLAALQYTTQIDERGPRETVLTVAVEPDSAGRKRFVHVSLIVQAPDDDLAYLSLVQWYAPLSVDVPSEHRDEVARRLIDVNRQSALGHFGMTAEGSLYHRYVHATAKLALVDPPVLQQVLLVQMAMLDRFTPTLESISTPT